MANETIKYLDYKGLVLYDELMKATIDKDGEVIATALTDLDNRINNIQLTPGSPGQDGTDGKSAYEIAQDNGFQGSEQDWLASLVGPSGQNGTNGTNGKNLEFDWNGTSLGVRQQGESQYSYVNLKGDPGTNGTNGTNGLNGTTPHIDSTTGNWFIGETNTGVQAQGPSGQNGTNGTNGTDGVSCTHSWNGTTLSITSASGTSSADLKGAPGTDGTDGKSIKAVQKTSGTGAAGTTDTYTMYTDTAKTESVGTFDVYNGSNGTNGTNGTNGISPSISVSTITNGHKISITDSTHDSQNPLEFNVMDGTATQVMTGASVDNTGAEPINVQGASGLVPAPAAGDHNKFLRGDGTWVAVSGGGGPSGSGYAMIGDLDSEAIIPDFNAENDTVHVTVQNLSDAQKAQARTNIGAISVSDLNTGLSTKVNAATTLSGYGITDANINGGVITLGSNTITPITSSDIANLESKVTIESKTAGAFTAEVGKYYRFASTINSTTAITLPIPSDTTHLSGIMFYFTTDSTANRVTFSSTATIKKYDGYEIAASSTYEVSAVYNGSVWVIAATKLI